MAFDGTDKRLEIERAGDVHVQPLSRCMSLLHCGGIGIPFLLRADACTGVTGAGLGR